MPPAVMTSSPTSIEPSISWCRLACCRWGRISSTYMKTSSTRMKIRVAFMSLLAGSLGRPATPGPTVGGGTGIAHSAGQKYQAARALLARSRLRGHRLAESLERGRLEGREPPALDRRPCAGGQVEEKADVVLRQEDEAEELLLVHQVAEVGT